MHGENDGGTHYIRVACVPKPTSQGNQNRVVQPVASQFLYVRGKIWD
jgi:hypothetical protein